MSVAQYVAWYLASRRVPYVVGIPGHGNMTFVDALQDHGVPMVMVRHEQSAAHLADGFYRVTHQPLVITTSVGPGAINTLVGLATAMADSIPLIAITGNCQTYFVERGSIQDISYHHAAEFSAMARPVVKQSWSVTRAGDVPDVIQRAFRAALTGRRGPVHIELPMDVQSATIDAPMIGPENYDVDSRQWPDPAAIRRLADELLSAKRPVLLAGGGVVLADAGAELVKIAEHVGAPVITTTQSKGVIPEDHELNAFYVGVKGSTCGTNLTRSADCVLAIGFRFAEFATGSWKDGEVFSIPPTKLLQIDIDAAELGRNYPVRVPVLADAKAALTALLAEIRDRTGRVDYRGTPYFVELQQWKAEWESLKSTRISPELPMNLSTVLAGLRQALPRDAIVVTSSGHSQGHIFQEFPVYDPKAHLSAGGFSTMGWSVPAALGASLGSPDRPVVAILGDGDFLMTCQELATAVQYRIPVVFCVLNNSGFLSIRDGQARIFGLERTIGTESRFVDDGEWYSPDFVAMAESFGARGVCISRPEEITSAVRDALSARSPFLIEIKVASEFPRTNNGLGMYADFPRPEHLTEEVAPS